MNTATILLGCNRGVCEDTFDTVIALLNQECGSVFHFSSRYQTAAWGKEDQAPFLNQAIQLKTELTAEALIIQTANIENKLGRIREEMNGPRTIDIDILFFNDLQVITNRLIIPHPRLHLRKFTLIPLNEIIPDYLHPTLKKTIRELLLECTDKLDVVKKEVQF
ncbi:MAG: 2-amino-4-hydroxy-6-hydroxymethyldihydropteridine diphosphokinase [Bacteroidota bacterium]